MKQNQRLLAATAFYCGLVLAIIDGKCEAQTQINLGAQSKNIDFTGAQWTRPIKTGSTLPATCSTGDFFLNTTATPGQNLFSCLANTWSLVGQVAGLADPGSNGIVKRTALNTTTTVTAPGGAIVGTTDTQTLTNKSIDGSEINSGTITAARLPGLSGDVTASAGSTATVLSTVNSTPGSFGDATHAVQMSVDAKGRVTGISQVPIVGGASASYYQQLSKNGSALTQRAALNLSSAFAVSDNSTNSRTDVDLATVNSNTGTFGSATQIPVITVNGYGQVTAVSTIPASGSSAGGSSTTLAAGALASIPTTCAAGALYFATDQSTSQQLYTCSSSNTWTQYISLGGSGALAFTNGALDVVTSVVPRLASANTFTGLNTFPGGVKMGGGIQPSCDVNARGLFWYQNNGSSKDAVQVCVYTGSAYLWTSLY